MSSWALYHSFSRGNFNYPGCQRVFFRSEAAIVNGDARISIAASPLTNVVSLRNKNRLATRVNLNEMAPESILGTSLYAT